MVYVVLAEGFEEIEALTPVDILRRECIEVKTVGIGSKTVTGSHNISVNCDLIDSEIKLNDELKAVILPGGMPGTLNLGKSKAVADAVKFAEQKGLLIAAICAAPSVLGALGVLKGKNATCFSGFEDKLIGAKVLNMPVVKDGNIITANGMPSSLLFAREIADYLK